MFNLQPVCCMLLVHKSVIVFFKNFHEGGLASNFNVTEKMAALSSMKGPVTELCEQVTRNTEKFNINLNKLHSNDKWNLTLITKKNGLTVFTTKEMEQCTC